MKDIKTIEKIQKRATKQVGQYENSYFSNKQYGFIKGRSTVLQLLKIMDDWTTSQLDSGGQIDVIYTDFAKAFDTVPHHRLGPTI